MPGTVRCEEYIAGALIFPMGIADAPQVDNGQRPEGPSERLVGVAHEHHLCLDTVDCVSQLGPNPTSLSPRAIRY
jgi:hypothetical protein